MAEFKLKKGQKVYHIREFASVLALARRGLILASDPIFVPSLERWVLAGAIRELRPLLQDVSITESEAEAELLDLPEGFLEPIAQGLEGGATIELDAGDLGFTVSAFSVRVSSPAVPVFPTPSGPEAPSPNDLFDASRGERASAAAYSEADAGTTPPAAASHDGLFGPTPSARGVQLESRAASGLDPFSSTGNTAPIRTAWGTAPPPPGVEEWLAETPTDPGVRKRDKGPQVDVDALAAIFAPPGAQPGAQPGLLSGAGARAGDPRRTEPRFGETRATEERGSTRVSGAGPGLGSMAGLGNGPGNGLGNGSGSGLGSSSPLFDPPAGVSSNGRTNPGAGGGLTRPSGTNPGVGGGLVRPSGTNPGATFSSLGAASLGASAFSAANGMGGVSSASSAASALPSHKVGSVGAGLGAPPAFQDWVEAKTEGRDVSSKLVEAGVIEPRRDRPVTVKKGTRWGRLLALVLIVGGLFWGAQAVIRSISRPVGTPMQGVGETVGRGSGVEPGADKQQPGVAPDSGQGGVSAGDVGTTRPGEDPGTPSAQDEELEGRLRALIQPQVKPMRTFDLAQDELFGEMLNLRAGIVDVKLEPVQGDRTRSVRTSEADVILKLKPGRFSAEEQTAVAGLVVGKYLQQAKMQVRFLILEIAREGAEPLIRQVPGKTAQAFFDQQRSYRQYLLEVQAGTQLPERPGAPQ